MREFKTLMKIEFKVGVEMFFAFCLEESNNENSRRHSLDLEVQNGESTCKKTLHDLIEFDFAVSRLSRRWGRNEVGEGLY